MLCKLIVEVPADLQVEDPEWQAANAEVCYEISSFGAVWPGFTLSSTKIIDGRKIMLCSLTVPGNDKLLLIEGLFAIYGLDWQVLALQEFGATAELVEGYVIPHSFMDVQPRALEFCDDRQEDGVDELGNITMINSAPTVGWLPVFDGQSPWV